MFSLFRSAKVNTEKMRSLSIENMEKRRLLAGDLFEFPMDCNRPVVATQDQRRKSLGDSSRCKSTSLSAELVDLYFPLEGDDDFT